MRIVTIALLACLSFSLHAAQYHADEVANGFQVPWGIEFIDSQRVVVNEKNGTISLLNVMTGQRQKIHTVQNVNTSGQAGLLDVALAPNTDKKNPQLYFTYSKRTQKGNTVALATATLNGEQLTGWKDLFIADAITDTGRHFGSRIAFIDGKIYFTIGDRGERDNGQNTQTHAGSILRLNLDGTVPTDNPFTSSKAKPEIWSFGHRNPQGLFYDKETDQLWSIEHGPRGGDEINLIKKGRTTVGQESHKGKNIGAHLMWVKRNHCQEWKTPNWFTFPLSLQAIWCSIAGINTQNLTAKY